MRLLTERAHQQLLSDLADALTHVRAAASDQAYRARACRTVGEQVLWRYHDRQHTEALATVSALHAARTHLSDLPRTTPGQTS